MTREYTPEEKRMYARRNLTSRANNKLGIAEKKGGKALGANIENAHRREWGAYATTDSMSQCNDEDLGIESKEYATREMRRLDPVGAKYEDVGDTVSAMNSRIAQAKALTSRGYENYYSAGALYAAAGEIDDAIKAYKHYLEINPGSRIAYRSKEITLKRISDLEKKLEYQNKRIERKRIASLSLSLGGLLGGLFLFSTNITGNVIADTNPQMVKIVGAILIIISLLFGFFFLRKNKSNNKINNLKKQTIVTNKRKKKK